MTALSVYEQRIQNRVARAKERETYYTRRRHALARVRKALTKAFANSTKKPTTVDEVVVVDVWVTLPQGPNAVPARRAYLEGLRIPFDLTTPEIVRLIQVRARLAAARKGT